MKKPLLVLAAAAFGMVALPAEPQTSFKKAVEKAVGVKIDGKKAGKAAPKDKQRERRKRDDR